MFARLIGSLSFLFAGAVTAAADAPLVAIDETAAIASAHPPAAPNSDRASLVVFSLKGKVQAVEDGDTVTLEAATGARFTIRFSDIDTPEVSHPAFTPRDCRCAPVPMRPGQPGGQAAKASLLELVAIGDEVTAECYEMDQYGRSVCHIFKASLNLNLEQIRRGWGWLPNNTAWVRDPQSQPAENSAKDAKVGAWSLPDQVPPADWRRACWKEAKCDHAEQ